MGRKEPAPDKHPWYRTATGWVGVRDVPWAGVAWILVGAALYSALLLAMYPKGFWEWLSTFVATALSVLGALFVYRHQVNRAEHERQYRMNMAMDAELEALLIRIDDSRRQIPALDVTLPSGRVAYAIPRLDDGGAAMLEEFAKSGLGNWKGSLVFFAIASHIRAYAVASNRLMALYDTFCTLDQIRPDTEDSLVEAAELVEHHRTDIVKHCKVVRRAMKEWFERYPHYSPWGPEARDQTPDWSQLEDVPQDAHVDVAQDPMKKQGPPS